MTQNQHEPPLNVPASSPSPPEDEQPPREWSLVLTCVVINISAWELGLLCHQYGGPERKTTAASLCLTTWSIAPFLILAAGLYSPLRRFVLPVRTWDIYGPVMSVLTWLVMQWQASPRGPH